VQITRLLCRRNACGEGGVSSGVLFCTHMCVFGVCDNYLRYPPKRDRLYTVGPEPKGRLAGREHIADVAVGVWEEDEGVD
jgi:hypothetical protein